MSANTPGWPTVPVSFTWANAEEHRTKSSKRPSGGCLVSQMAFLSDTKLSGCPLCSINRLTNYAAPVDAQELLARLAEIPITTWNYKAQDPSIRHIGPMADDFNALVEGLGGEGEDYINTLDADGVALAAVQGLYAQNQALEVENAALRQRVDGLEARLSALEAKASSEAAASPIQAGLLPGAILPWAGVLLAGLGVVLSLPKGLVWVLRRGGGLKPPEGGGR